MSEGGLPLTQHDGGDGDGEEAASSPLIGPDAGEPDRPRLVVDLAFPWCHVAMEALLGSGGGGLAVWVPVDAGTLPGPHEVAPDREALGRSAVAAGALPLRWPPAWPPDSRRAMLAATYAARAGKVVAFLLAASRQAYAAGRDLGDDDTVLLAAAAAEVHPRAVLKALGTPSVARALDATTAAAAAVGVRTVPAWVDGDRVLHGAAALAAATRAA